MEAMAAMSDHDDSDNMSLFEDDEFDSNASSFTDTDISEPDSTSTFRRQPAFLKRKLPKTSPCRTSGVSALLKYVGPAYESTHCPPGFVRATPESPIGNLGRAGMGTNEDLPDCCTSGPKPFQSSSAMPRDIKLDSTRFSSPKPRPHDDNLSSLSGTDIVNYALRSGADPSERSLILEAWAGFEMSVRGRRVQPAVDDSPMPSEENLRSQANTTTPEVKIEEGMVVDGVRPYRFSGLVRARLRCPSVEDVAANLPFQVCGPPLYRE